jgi:DNA-binding NarL/FixJ family response regulator
MIRVAIADDHAVIRAGVRAALSLGPDTALVGEASDGKEALQVCAREQPDVLLLDLMMPGGDGYTVLQRLPELCPGTRVLILSMHDTGEHKERSLSEGARGFLSKDVSPITILKAIRSVAAGEIWAGRLTTSNVLGSRATEVSESGRSPLTSREREVLGLLARGLRNREIAHELGSSEKTIASQVSTVVQKLGVRSRVEAALVGRRLAEEETS